MSVQQTEGTSRHSRWRVVTRLGWGVAGQAISSLSNFALGLFVARTLGASEFGAFTLAFVTYTVVLNAARGLATDPFLVRFSGAPMARWRHATSSATGTSLCVGLVASVVCVGAGLLLPDPLGPVFIALGIGLPGIVVQDSFRFAFFASSRGACAFMNDLFRSALLVAVLIVVHVRGDADADRCMLAFGVTATFAALLGVLQAQALPLPSRAREWLGAHRHLSVRYLVENVSISGAAQVGYFVLGAVTSLAAVGHVRASEIMMGPFLVIVMGISQVAVPEASRVFHRESHRLRRFCLTLGLVQAAGAIVWGLILIFTFPLGPGPALIKELWAPTAPLLPAITLTVVAVSFINAAAAGLRAMGVARRSLRAQLISSVAYVVGASVGAVLNGAMGASWGVTAAHALAALIWWHQLRAALSDHHRSGAVAGEDATVDDERDLQVITERTRTP